jgi:molybdopterin-containing oxidoreductase family membrane subunit
VLATSFLTSYGYMSEQTLTWLAGEEPDRYVYLNRLIALDEYALVTWSLVLCNTVVPQLLWFRSVRRSQAWLIFVSLAVLTGMWLERFMIITTSLHRDYLPSAWGFFKPTIWDIATYVGSIGLFFVAFLLFARLLPMISMSEMRALVPGSHAPEVGR